jgi:hyaluronan synthase
MWEEACEEIELETRPRSLFFTLPFVKEKIDVIAVFLIVTGGTSIVTVTVKFRLLPLWIDFLQSSRFLKVSGYLLVVLAAVFVSGTLFRTLLWLRYRPQTAESIKEEDWPSVTVLMPGYNEEELISKAIDSIFSVNYPREKLDVIAINDGSTDLTLLYMQRAKRRYGDRLRVISFKRNLGKRKALYSAMKIARGDVVVTVDTDGKIGRSAIRNLVVPLIKEPEVGAVAGRVAALNERDNFLTRMLSVRYAVSFDFGRAYQSVFGTVLVCPGALTAYRRTALGPLMKKWVNQRFMNSPCLHGEDRALTTYILRSGHLTKYQSNAVVYSKVPSRFRQMNRMYIRWTRSFIRESALFAGFMFSRYRKKHRLLPVLDFFFLNLLHPFHLFAVGLLSYSFVVQPIFILRHLAFLVILSFFLSLYYLRTNRSPAFLYGIPYALITAFLLWWIVPFSALTLKNQSWLTR